MSTLYVRDVEKMIKMATEIGEILSANGETAWGQAQIMGTPLEFARQLCDNGKIDTTDYSYLSNLAKKAALSLLKG